ncbi:MAG: hypothetical protein JWM17_910 [Actinobacteria bacterium]|nr:hypothetical protein [Actinomycetota bacterium]
MKEIRERQFGLDHSDTVWARYSLACALHELGRLEGGGRRVPRGAECARRGGFIPGHLETQDTAARLARLLEQRAL